jgi:hypothetical protein
MQPLSYPKCDDERASERTSVSLAGSVRELRSVSQPVKILDLTAAGCRIAGTDLRANDEIWVRVGRENPIRARVVWAAKGELGCSFYRPLSRCELQGILTSAGRRRAPLFTPPARSTFRGI